MPILRTGSSRTTGACPVLFGSVVFGWWICAGAGIAHAQAAPGSQINSGVDAGASTSGTSQTLAAPNTAAIGERRIHISANAGATYDSNATRSNALRPTPPGEHKQDVLFPLGLDVDVYVPVGSNIFSLSGYAGYNKALHNRNLDSENISLNGGYQRDFHPCTLDVTGGYQRGRTDYADTDFLSFTKNIQTISTAGGNVTCGPQVGFRPFASINYTTGRNSDLNRRLNDYDAIVYGGGIGFAQSTLGGVGLIGSLSRNTYTNRPASGLLGANRTNVKNVGVYFKRASARILQANIQLNYTAVKSSPATKEFHGLSGSAEVRFVPGGRFIFDGTLSRAVTTSLSYNSSYNIDTTGLLTATAAWNSKLSSTLGYQRSHRDYVGVPDIGTHILTSDNNQQINGSAAYMLGPRIGLYFGVSYLTRSANDPIFNYSAVRVSAGVHVRLL